MGNKPLATRCPKCGHLCRMASVVDQRGHLERKVLVDVEVPIYREQDGDNPISDDLVIVRHLQGSVPHAYTCPATCQQASKAMRKNHGGDARNAGETNAGKSAVR